MFDYDGWKCDGNGESGYSFANQSREAYEQCRRPVKAELNETPEERAARWARLAKRFDEQRKASH